MAKIASERRATEAVRTYSLWQAMYNPKVLLLALNYFGIVVASLGMLIFVPQIIKSLGGQSDLSFDPCRRLRRLQRCRRSAPGERAWRGAGSGIVAGTARPGYTAGARF